jgi:hypothetical protein
MLTEYSGWSKGKQMRVKVLRRVLDAHMAVGVGVVVEVRKLND